MQKNVEKTETSTINFFPPFLTILGRPGVDFQPFLVPKQVPGGNFFGVFLKTAIVSKSCSPCGGSTVLKGQTLQKLIRRATPNGTGEKNRQKSLPAPSSDALFRSRARFLSILGSRPGPKIDPKPLLENTFRCLFGSAGRFLVFFVARVCSAWVPDRFWRLRGPSQTRF